MNAPASWLVFVESNTSGTGRLLARAAGLNGFRPILLTADPSPYKFLEDEKLDTIQVNTRDVQALLDVCYNLAGSSKLAGVTSSSDHFLEIAAILAHHLGLPGSQPSTIHNCRDKQTQRLLLQAAGVDVPKFCSASSVEQAVTASQSIGFPVVLKPVSDNGSTGVKLCKCLDEVVLHANALLQRRQTERGLPIPHRILVEELVVGPEYSVEVFGTRIVGITEKHLGPLPYFVEVGHDHPAILSAEVEKSISLSVRRTLDALDWGWGPAHVELRITKGGPKIIEVNPRLGGDYIPELMNLAYDMDLISETVRLVVGAKPRLEKKASQHASIRFILPSREGLLKGIDGLDFAKQVPGVVEAQIYHQMGDRIHLQGNFRDRAGHVIGSGDTPMAARAAVEFAHKAIQLTIKPDTTTPSA
ncbi:ATP-grasp domain-containing protein [Scytonema sp. PCC 10023]|uniref:ATP-grasp domain-containing protein n=1 Tax=Scytonema sp. PCC 10023 TaxID=1680591 RepID=UPI0039C5CB74